MAVLLASPPYAGYQINNLIRQKDSIEQILNKSNSLRLSAGLQGWKWITVHQI